MSTVDQRREREEYDRKNPWRSMTEEVPRGAVCEILFSDLETSRTNLFFLHEDGKWYAIQTAGDLGFRKPMNWRPTGAKCPPDKRAEIVSAANKRGW